MVSILRDATGCRRELKIEIEKQFLCQKILLLPYKENWSKMMAYFRKVVLLMQIMSKQLLA